MLVFLLIIIAVFLVIAPFALLIGLYKIFFQKEDKQFGIQLIIYSVITLIVGFGTCATIGNLGI